MSRSTLTRRRAFAVCGGFVASSRASGQPLVPAIPPVAAIPPLSAIPPVPAIPPLEETVNIFEIEAAAKARLAGAAYSEIAGSDRGAFDRITFRPRMMVDTTKLDLSLDLFGARLFAPILVGPVAGLDRFHTEGDLAMVRGAAAANTTVIIASRSAHAIDRIAAQSGATLWCQVHLEEDMSTVIRRAQDAVKAGCKAVCLTLAGPEVPPRPLDSTAIDRLRQAVSVPLLLKGIMSAEDARTGIARGAQGVIVSNYRGRVTPALAAPIEVLPAIVDAIGAKAPVLIDGSFRRGSDVLKALALGARAVLVARPAVWGLAAYGAEGVQRVLELMQSELARDMVMCGKPNLAAIDRNVIRIHSR